MYFSGKWGKRLCAAMIGAAVVGAPLFVVHAEDSDGGMSRHDPHRYDVRRGMYEKKGGSDTEVNLGRYADEKHEKEHIDGEKKAHQEEVERHEGDAQQEELEGAGREEVDRKEDSKREQEEPREYKYDVRRGAYEKAGGSDTEVSRGKYEQPSEDGQRRGLQR